MGIWGAKLYDDDRAADIKDAFVDFLDAGLSPIESAEKIEAEFSEVFQDSEDGSIARAALADLLWKKGCLDEERKQIVLTWLESGGDLAHWQQESPRRAEARKRNLDKLYQQLLSPMSTPKQPNVAPKNRRKQLPWNAHELYAFPLLSEEAAQQHLQNAHALIYIQGESSIYDGYRNPRVWVKIALNGCLPRSSEEFDQLDFLRIACTPFERRFSPFSREDELPPDFRQDYRPDAWGLLPEYTLELTQSTRNHPPDTLQLLGVFEDVQPPTYEYFRYRSMPCCSWKFAEQYILQRYAAHTLHQSAYYDSQSPRES